MGGREISHSWCRSEVLEEYRRLDSERRELLIDVEGAKQYRNQVSGESPNSNVTNADDRLLRNERNRRIIKKA